MYEKEEQDVLLELRKVSHFFDQRLVFRDISLKLKKGSVLILAGPNGAGKTTLINIMSGLISPASGSVLAGVPREKRAFLGHYTFNYPGLSALENLSFWAGIYGLSKNEQELIDLLILVGLKGFAHEKARTYSRGMAQRLSLARVLMLEPELMFLDEPATGMDARSREMLREQIRSARKRDAGIVWVSHTLEEDLNQADMVLYLQNKKAAYKGPVSEFRAEVLEAAH